MSTVTAVVAGLWNRMRRSKAVTRILKGAVWSLASAAISRGVSLLLSIWIARLAGTEVFGELGVLQSTTVMFGTLSGFGLGLTATKFVAEYRCKSPRTAGKIVKLSTLASLVTGIACGAIMWNRSAWLATYALAAPHLEDALRLSSCLIFLGTVNGVQTGVLIGFEEFKTIARNTTLTAVAAIPVTIIAVRLGGALEGFVWSLIINQAITTIVGYHAIRQIMSQLEINITVREALTEWRVLVTYSLPALLTNLLVSPVNWACSTMMASLPNGYTELGILNMVQQWRAFALFLPGILAQVMFPFMAERLRGAGSGDSMRVVRKVFYAQSIISLPVFMVLCLTSPMIVASYGPTFSSATTTFIIMQCASLMQTLQAPLIKYFESTNRMWLNLTLNIGWAILTLSLSKALVIYGALGLCIAQLTAFSAFGLLLLFSIRGVGCRNQSAIP